MTIHMIQAAHMDHLGRSPARIHSASVLVFNLHIIQGHVSACTVRLHCPPSLSAYSALLCKNIVRYFFYVEKSTCRFCKTLFY